MPLCSRLCRQHLSERLSVRLYTHKAFAGRHLPRYHRFSTEHTRSLGPQTGRVSAEYCERPVKYGEQHCREIGSHKRYDDKCKNESIWLAYNRADKTHYARYLKRKMTTAQFEQWSRYTVELRQKAENSEMELADYPWTDTPRAAVFRHTGNRKWFALVMDVPRDKLGLPGTEKLDIVNFKCDPILIASLRGEAGIFPAYHMNKANWITAALDGSAPAEMINFCWM